MTRRSKRLVFSLRGLLIFVALVSVVLALTSWQLRRAKQQREAVVALNDFGFRVVYDYQYDDAGQPILDAVPGVPAWLLDLFGKDFFYSIVVVLLDTSGSVGDGDLPELIEHLRALSDLDLASLQWDCGLSRSGFSELRRALPHCEVDRAGDFEDAEMRALAREYARRNPEGREKLLRQLDEAESKETVLNQYHNELKKIREEWRQQGKTRWGN